MAELTLPVDKDIVYKIRRKTDGLFSMGGSQPHFSKKGKIWKQRSHLTSHINQLRQGSGVSSHNYSHPYQTHVYADCEIVAYRIVEEQVGDTQTIMDYVAERREEERQKEIRAQQRREEAAKKARREQYEQLKAEFE